MLKVLHLVFFASAVVNSAALSSSTKTCGDESCSVSQEYDMPTELARLASDDPSVYLMQRNAMYQVEKKAEQEEQLAEIDTVAESADDSDAERAEDGGDEEKGESDEGNGGTPDGECKTWCAKHADSSGMCNWGGCAGCSACPEPKVPEKAPEVSEEEPEGLAKPYASCSESGSLEKTCLTARDGGKFRCYNGKCAGGAGRGDKCRDSSYSGTNHKAWIVCNGNNKCVGFDDGKKWGKCVAK